MAIADLQVSTEELPGSQIGITVEVPQAEVDRAFDRVVQRLQQRVKIEGFRPGKAPRELVEARVGESALREEALELLVPEVVSQVLEEKSIEAIDRPRVDVEEFERGKAARFKARVSLYPEVKLADLDQLEVETAKPEVTEEMVDRRIEELRDRLAEVTPVDRPAQRGDIVVADIDVEVDGQDVPAEQRRAIEVEVKEEVLIPELLAAVPGHSAGETVEADITLPEDHVDESLRSKPAHIRFTVQGVKEKKLPPLDDELAGQLTEGKQQTLAALRDAVRDDLDETSARLAQLTFEQAVVKEVVERSQVEIPQSMVDHEVAHQLEELEQRLQQQGLRLDRYLTYLQKTPEEWVGEARPDAESRIKVDLVLEAVGKKLQVEPSDDEVMAFMRSEAARDPELQQRYLEMVANRGVRDYFRHRLARLQVLQRLVEKAGGTPAPVFSTEEAAAIPEDQPVINGIGEQQNA
jgi:trigger factor